MEEILRSLEEEFSCLPLILIKTVLRRDGVYGDIDKARKKLQEFQGMEKPLDVSKSPKAAKSATGKPKVLDDSQVSSYGNQAHQGQNAIQGGGIRGRPEGGPRGGPRGAPDRRVQGRGMRRAQRVGCDQSASTGENTKRKSHFELNNLLVSGLREEKTDDVALSGKEVKEVLKLRNSNVPVTSKSTCGVIFVQSLYSLKYLSNISTIQFI